MVKEAHKKGLEIVAWNTDDVEEMRRLISLGVDAIGTNRPDIL